MAAAAVAQPVDLKTGVDPKEEARKAVKEHVRKYEKADDSQAWLTVAITIGVYVLSLCTYPLWKYPLLYYACAIFRGMVGVRMFIVLHDCAHSSFFSKVSTNVFVGRLMSGPILTPFSLWKRGHLIHHRVSGNEDVKNDPGSTVFFSKQDYSKLSPGLKAAARFFRDPFVFFSLTASLFFWVIQPFPKMFLLRMAPAKSRAKQTDEEYCHICKIIEFAVFCSLFGKQFILFEVIAGCVAAISGFLMFHWQHIVPPNTYRKPSSEYDRVDAALEGATFLMVPFWLKWMTLGIEYHHIHHLSTAVPCYKIEECHLKAPKGMFDNVIKVDGRMAAKSFFLVMWDEEKRQYVPFDSHKWIVEAL